MPSESSDRGDVVPEPGSAGDAALQELIEHYLQELADGHQPDQAEYLRAHPALADALRGVFKTLDFVEATSRALRPTPLERGQQLGEYRILREVARGGMGVVYEALQTSLNRRVALKVLPAGALLSQSAPERFVREATAAARLHHTNIVPVYATGQEQGLHYYVMQFIEGHSLAEHLKRLRASGADLERGYFRRVARWGEQVAGALAYAHGERVIHRDIKPANLLLDARDNIWITDFGLARADPETTLTVTGDVLGTARYMSPEQARGDGAAGDGRTDIYSLGATLYELLALTPAFDGQSRDAVLNQILSSEPPPLWRLNRAVPRDLETIVAKCMQKTAADRYAAAADVADDCRRFLAGEPIRARRTPRLVKAGRFVQRHRLGTLGTFVVLALAVSTALLVLSLRHVQGQRRVDEAMNVILFERDTRRAGKLLDEAQAFGVDSAALHLCRGLAAVEFGKPERAIAPFEEALRREPNNVEAALALAFAYASVGDAVRGEQLLSRHGESEIDTALGWLLRGQTLALSGGTAATEAFNRAIALRPDFIPAIEVRAFSRADRVLVEGVRHELEPMLRDFEAWVVFRATSSRAYASRAMGWLMAAAYADTQADLRGHAEEWLCNCRRDLDQAMALRGPDDVGPYARRAGYLEYVGDFRGLAELLAEASAIDRGSTGQVRSAFVHYRVLALHALGEVDAALHELEPACAAVPNSWLMALQRVLLLGELARLEEARAVGRACLSGQSYDSTGLVVAAFVELLGERDLAAAFVRGSVAESVASGATASTAAENPGGAYLAGHSDAAALLAAANGHPGRTCEFAFLIALRELGLGNRTAGRRAIQACLDTRVFTFVQFRFAQILAARLDSNPNWPPWIPVTPDP